MNMPDIIDRIRHLLRNIAPEAKTILYGSQARGDAREDSDIDLLILLPDACGGRDFVRKKLDISGQLYDLSLMTGKNISPLILVHKVFYARKTPFTINVINEGIVL